MLQRLFGVGELSPEKFAALVAQIGVEEGVLEAPSIDVEEMRITDRDQVMHLHNIYAAFLAAPRRKRLALVRQYAVSTKQLDIPDGFEDVRPRLRPVIRDGAYLALAGLQASRSLAPSGAKMPEIAHAPLAPDVYLTFVIDAEHSMAVVSESLLASWGVTFEQAREVAIANLRRATTEHEFQQIMEHVWVSTWNDSYAAARLLLPDVIQRVCADPLVCIPNRDVLLVADARHGFPGMVAALAEIVEDQRYPISRRVFQLEHHALRAYEPPADASTEAKLAHDRLYAEERVQVYGEERALHEDDEQDVFYAHLKAFILDGGEVKTYATWTRGVPSLLPPAQAIMFVDVDDPASGFKSWSAPWAVVQAEPGMLTRTSSPLERWQTGTFPSPAWLAEHAERFDSKPTGGDVN
ncbi:MAG TPA: DUF1444 family protein [Kofleriaceae bacterium]|jgi:hypothetical protein|nr:DUF1444 family protein [Kofleriaceae bacterium]